MGEKGRGVKEVQKAGGGFGGKGGRQGGERKKGGGNGRRPLLTSLAKMVSFSQRTGDFSPHTHLNQELLTSNTTPADMRDKDHVANQPRV